jgi:hydroxymethylpyrimidine pyrophosphatase-like HAD family hydrolase
MIKLFITDLDGCISTPFKTPDWNVLSKIRRLNEQHVDDMAVPPLSICSGRPQPYVEAVAQWLGIRHPVSFESAGIFHIDKSEIEFLPVFNRKAEKQVHELKEWLKDEIIADYSGMMLEFTKRMDAGIIHAEKEVIDEAFPKITSYISDRYPLFEAHKTDVSVNVILSDNNKRNGVLTLCERFGIKPEEAAYIGDSSGDIPALEVVGRPFAPSNAADVVKDHAEVLDVEVTEAVLKAYRLIIRENREVLSEKLSG